MSNLLRKIFTGSIAAASLGAMVVATSTPAAAWGHRGHWGPGPGIAAGVIGGLAVGALIAGAARPAYAEPAYGGYAAYDGDGYAPACHREWRPIYTADGQYLRDRLVRVCD